MSRIILSVKEIHSFAGKGMSEDAFETRLAEDDEYRYSLAKKYAMKHKLHNGATLEFPAHGYRNHNLLFWDSQNNEIVDTFCEIDDYGSVPPRFVVGDGYFNPTDWLDEVEHNSFVFPAKPLINEMKEFVLEHPDKKKMVVKINGNNYIVRYNPVEMKDKWDSCILEVDPFETNKISVYPGDQKWRETIIDDIDLPVAAPVDVAAPIPVAAPVDVPVDTSELDELKKTNEELTKMVEVLNKKIEELTIMVQQLVVRV